VITQLAIDASKGFPAQGWSNAAGVMLLACCNSGAAQGHSGHDCVTIEVTIP
jgi:hypothetical protein